MAPINSKNPAAIAILNGTAPTQARLAAASGLLPLPQADLLEVLVALQKEVDPTIAEAAVETLLSMEREDFLSAAKSDDTAASVLAYLATAETGDHEIKEAVVLNGNTSDQAIADMASTTAD